MKILNRYIRNMVVSATGFVVLVLIGMNCLIALMAEIHDVGKMHYTIAIMCQYVFMHVPAVTYLMFPIAAFIGCLLGLGRLATGSELTVMQANGVSVAQVTWSVVKAALFMSLVVSVIGETIAPKWEQESLALKAMALGNRAASFTNLNNIWLRHENSYVYIGHILSATHIAEVSEFVFQKNQLHEIIYAQSAEKRGNHWELINVSKTLIEEDHTAKQAKKTEELNLNFTADQLQNFDPMSLQGSVVDVWHTIIYRREAGLLTTLFELTFWQRVIQPVTTLIMICLGIPFIFGSLRNVSATIRLVAGIAVGIGFYMFSRFFGPITLIYQLPPFLGAIGPTLFFFCIYIYMTLKRS